MKITRQILQKRLLALQEAYPRYAGMELHYTRRYYHVYDKEDNHILHSVGMTAMECYIAITAFHQGLNEAQL